MRDFEWSPAGDLLRYTGNTYPFHGSDPFTQIAGCYFAGMFAEAAGNTAVRYLARDVIGKWFDEIFRSNDMLGPSGPKILLPNLIVLKQVAQKIGVDQTRLDHLTLLIDEQKIIAAGGSLRRRAGRIEDRQLREERLNVSPNFTARGLRG